MSLADTTSEERLSLEIPPDSGHILTARLFASGVARSLQLDDEITDVLRLALSEICSEAIEQRRGGRIVIDVSADSDPIRVTVTATGAPSETDNDPTEAKYRRSLIEALAPDTSFVQDQDRLTVRFTLLP